MEKYVVAIIPARGGSKRLLRKNIFSVFGKPMIYWVIKACQKSKKIDEVYVSTEDSEIKKIALGYGVKVIDRLSKLADDYVPKMEAIKHGVKVIEKEYRKPDIVISVQPNSPEIKPTDLNKAITKLEENNLWEVFSVDSNLLQNGAFRVLTYDAVFSDMLSVYCGVVITDYIDIHTKEDIKELENKN